MRIVYQALHHYWKTKSRKIQRPNINFTAKNLCASAEFAKEEEHISFKYNCYCILFRYIIKG